MSNHIIDEYFSSPSLEKDESKINKFIGIVRCFIILNFIFGFGQWFFSESVIHPSGFIVITTFLLLLLPVLWFLYYNAKQAMLEFKQNYVIPVFKKRVAVIAIIFNIFFIVFTLISGYYTYLEYKIDFLFVLDLFVLIAFIIIFVREITYLSRYK